jgi:lambda family phage minor tail protein L
MTQPIVGTDHALVTDVQGQSQSSGFITVFEIALPDSNIGGTGLDKLFFHDGRNGTNDITWYSLDNESDFGSTTSSKYSQQTYAALPIESEGWEIRGSGSGSLPRPTIRMGNINQFFRAYLADWDDLVGAKVIRRRTLEKYLSTNPPVEFNRDVYYIERKSTETPIMVEFELTSAFDVEGIKLPRRSILAARCPWKYKDTTQGGCDWPEDSRLVEGVGDPLYFDKDDNIITKDAASPSASEYTYWGRQDVQANRETNLYLHNVTYEVGDYVEYQRPIGNLYSITSMVENATDRVTITVAAATASEFAAGDWLVIKGATHTSWNHKNVPLYIESKTSTTLVVQTDSTATGTLSTTGYIQACRNTLYKCKVEHTILLGDSIEDLIKPINISYWEFGDICGKRLSSCSKRFAHIANSGKVDVVHVKMVDGVLQGGAGYTSQPTITVTNTGTGGTGLVVRANGTEDPQDGSVTGGVILTFTVTTAGSGYNSNPTIAISGGGASTNAIAEARVKHQTTDNVALPFGGFPGASFG